MKSGLKFIVNLVILIAGILLIAVSRNAQAVKTIVFVTGVAFVIPAVANVLVLIKEGKNHEGEKRPSAMARWAGWLTSGGALTLGLVMCFFPESFHSLFIYIFGLALAFGGLYHLYMIYRGLRPVKFAAWLGLLPGLMIVGAMLMFFMGGLHVESGQSSAILITGIGCVLFATTTTIEYFTCRGYERGLSAMSHQGSASTADTSHRIEDVTATDEKA